MRKPVFVTEQNDVESILLPLPLGLRPKLLLRMQPQLVLPCLCIPRLQRIHGLQLAALDVDDADRRVKPAAHRLCRLDFDPLYEPRLVRELEERPEPGT